MASTQDVHAALGNLQACLAQVDSLVSQMVRLPSNSLSGGGPQMQQGSLSVQDDWSGRIGFPYKLASRRMISLEIWILKRLRARESGDSKEP